MLRRPWSTRSELERVDLYTRQTLFGLHVVFVLLTLATLVGSGRSEPVATAVFATAAVLVNVVGFVALRALVYLRPGDDPPRRLLGLLAILVVAVAPVILLLPDDARGPAALLLCLALSFGFGGYRDDRVSVAVVLACAALTWLPTHDLGVLAYGLGYGALLVFTVRVSLWVLDVMYELDRARGAQSALAVAEERLRFSRDVHDVLGRRLSTIAVQAELAATLARRGDPGAADRMLDVRATAHDALREARELARGYRSTSLEQEVEGARSLLRSAGIAMTSAVEDLPAPWREAAAWVVREATTNVLRHTSATTVEVRYAEGALTIVNDRPNAPTPTGAGTGLSGLRERLTPLGVTLSTHRADGTFTVTAAFPGEGPR